MREMTSRERVYAAINHREPDRVPISFSGTFDTGITECPPDGRICSKLYQYLGITDYAPIEYADWFNIVTNVDERVVQRLRSDMRWIGPNEPGAIVQTDSTKTWPYLCGIRIKKVGYYDEPFEWPMRYMTTKDDIDAYPWPDLSVDIMEGVVERAKYLHEQTAYFVVGESPGIIFPFAGYAVLCGMDKWLTDMKIRPQFYHQLCEKLLAIGTAINDQFFSGVGQYLDGVMTQDDLGTQVGGLISHKDYLSFYHPYTKEIIKNIRRYLRPEAKIIRHSCGSVYYAIADLIDLGVDVLHGVQPLARNMEPWRLKREFGDRITFLGGLDIQQLLPLGTTDQIREGVQKLIAEYGSGGGYIFAPAHNIEPDTPPENIVAAYDAAFEYGRYPLAEVTGESYVDFIGALKLH
jgi:uroporphyrinogen decarboxylase